MTGCIGLFLFQQWILLHRFLFVGGETTASMVILLFPTLPPSSIFNKVGHLSGADGVAPNYFLMQPDIFSGDATAAPEQVLCHHSLWWPAVTEN